MTLSHTSYITSVCRFQIYINHSHHDVLPVLRGQILVRRFRWGEVSIRIPRVGIKTVLTDGFIKGVLLCAKHVGRVQFRAGESSFCPAALDEGRFLGGSPTVELRVVVVVVVTLLCGW